MNYSLVVAPLAGGDLDETYLEYLRLWSEADADRWLATVYRSLATLDRMPERCGFAYESRFVNEPVRQLLIGRRRNCFRALFIVRGRTVFVLRVRHTSRAPLGTADLELPAVKDDANAPTDD